MNQVKLNLSTLKDIPIFIQAVSLVNDKMILKSGHYVVDAKSIMGIYSLDLSQPVILEAENNKELDSNLMKEISYLIIT